MQTLKPIDRTQLKASIKALDEFATHECETCNGTGRIEVLNCEVRGQICSNDRAGVSAGDVHHVEECYECRGSGQAESEDE